MVFKLATVANPTASLECCSAAVKVSATEFVVKVVRIALQLACH